MSANFFVLSPCKFKIQALTVAGTLEVAQGSNPTITADSFTLAAGGTINTAALPNGTPPSVKGSSLTFNIAAGVDIYGTIDLTGHAGIDGGAGENYGEDAGDLTINATSITVSGSIISNGGYGVRRNFGWPSQPISGGGNGGVISLNAATNVTVGGILSANGGSSSNAFLGMKSNGGNGGIFAISYGGTTNFIGGTFNANGGLEFGGYLVRGSAGDLAITYTGVGTPPALPVITVQEIEPNGGLNTAQQLIRGTHSTKVNAFVDGSDTTNLYWQFGGNPAEDLYEIEFLVAGPITVDLVPAIPTGIDLDLFIIARNGVGFGQSSTPSGTEQIMLPSLPAGKYQIAVSWFSGVGGSDYTLTVRP